MNKKEVRKLKLGLYKIFWKSGGWSFASVGQNKKGELWFAPCNWVSAPCFNWIPVLKVEEIAVIPRTSIPVMGTAEFIETAKGNYGQR